MAKSSKAAPASQSTHKEASVEGRDDWPGAFAVYWETFQRLRRNPGPAILIIAVYVGFSLLSSAVQGGKTYLDVGYKSYEDVAQLVFLLALPTYALALADRKHVSITDVTAIEWRKYLFVLLAGIMFVLIVGVSLALLVIPVIWAIGWFGFYQFPIVEDDLDSIEALQESKRLAQGHVRLIWGLIGVSLLLAIPTLALFALHYVVVPAYLMLIALLSYGATATLYRHLQRLARTKED